MQSNPLSTTYIFENSNQDSEISVTQLLVVCSEDKVLENLRPYLESNHISLQKLDDNSQVEDIVEIINKAPHFNKHLTCYKEETGFLI